MALTCPLACSLDDKVAITCGACGDPGQNGQYPSAGRFRSPSFPTITHERVIGSLRNSMAILGKHRFTTIVNGWGTKYGAPSRRGWPKLVPDTYRPECRPAGDLVPRSTRLPKASAPKALT